MASTPIYETSKLLEEYLLFHYATSEEIFSSYGDPCLSPDYPKVMIEACDFAIRTTKYFSSHHVSSSLDLGCAVGRSTLEIARNSDRTIGIDFSHSFIDAAIDLSKGKSVEYFRHDEAHLKTKLIAAAPREIHSSTILFEQGDAMNLRSDLGKFDRVHAANLLCRLIEPMKLLARFQELMNNGGELVIATPCTWLEEFTPSKNWPKQDTLSWLKEILLKDFDLKTIAHEPFLIRETARKFQWSQSLITVWQRK
jgi:putative 4-mercaptohistidine N1-methyltranferase